MNKLLKNKIWYFLTVLFLVIVVGVVGSAHATLITYYFTGQITYVPNPPPYGLNISVGDPVTGSFAYDPSLGYIQPPPAGMSVVIGGATIQSAGDASLQMINDSYGVDNFNGYFTPISVNGENQPSGSHAMNFYLADTSQTVFSSTALPVSLDAGSFDIRQGNIFAGLGITVSFSINTLSLIPPPAVTCRFAPVPSEPIWLIPGAIFRFWTSVQNNDDATQIFKFATRVKKPDGNWYPSSGWLLGPTEVTLTPHTSESKYLTLNIPKKAPYGTYIYYGYVGIAGPPPVLYDRCQFSFTVVR